MWSCRHSDVTPPQDRDDQTTASRVQLSLNDLRFHGPHGVYDDERARGNDFSVDVRMEGDLTAAIADDRLESSVDFDQVAAVVLNVHRKQPFVLIESLADAMARSVLEHFSLLTTVAVSVRKLTVRRLDSVQSVSAEVVRTRGDG